MDEQDATPTNVGSNDRLGAGVEARDRLMQALPHFRRAVAKARLQGEVKLGILAVNKDGSGQIMVRFDADDLFDDIATLLGAPPQSAEDDMQADAEQFLQQHGLSRGA